MITNTTWRVKYSESAGFTGGTPTFQTVASATDEDVIYGAGTDASPTGTQLLHTDGVYRFHVVAQSTAQTGSNTYPFWFGCTVSTTGVPASLFLLEGMLSGTYHSLDEAPRVIITWYVAGGPVQAGWRALTDTGFYARSWVLYNLVGATLKRFAVPALTTTINFAIVDPTTTTLNGFEFSPYNSSYVQPVPCLLVRTTNNGTLPGPKGFCHDVKLITANGHNYPTTIMNSTNAYVGFGGFYLQWPENVIPIK
jgi:hypothetical protein